MKFFSLALLSGLVAFASASPSSKLPSSLGNHIPWWRTHTLTPSLTGGRKAVGPHNYKSFPIPSLPSEIVHIQESCSKEDDADCTEFCKLTAQTASCIAAGNKVTCRCSGGKSESKCEERCLLCMPDKGALEEARDLLAMRKDL